MCHDISSSFHSPAWRSVNIAHLKNLLLSHVAKPSSHCKYGYSASNAHPQTLLTLNLLKPANVAQPESLVCIAHIKSCLYCTSWNPAYTAHPDTLLPTLPFPLSSLFHVDLLPTCRTSHLNCPCAQSVIAPSKCSRHLEPCSLVVLSQKQKHTSGISNKLCKTGWT